MKTIVNYLSDKFVDFENKEHNVTICCITSDALCNKNIRILRLGISIQNPVDIYDEELGKKIAFNKACNNSPSMTAERGIITKEIVNSIMNKTMAYVKNSPENYIASYAERKEKYENKLKYINKYENLNVEDKTLVNILKTRNLSNLEELKEIASNLY